MIRFTKLIGPFSEPRYERGDCGSCSALAIEVEGFVDFFLRGCLVDTDVADTTEQCEVDAARRVFLIMGHELKQGGVVIAGDGHAAVMFVDETDGLAHLVGGEACLNATQVEFADEAIGNGIAVKDGSVAECKRLEGMTYGVAEVQGLADAVLQRILDDDTLLDSHAVGQHTLETGKVERFVDEIEMHQFCPHCLVGDESVFEHLGIAGENVLVVESAQELCTEYDRSGIVEHPDLVLQSTEIDACLAADAGVDHSEQGGGDVDVVDATFEGRCRKAAQIGHHAPAYIY